MKRQNERNCDRRYIWSSVELTVYFVARTLPHTPRPLNSKKKSMIEDLEGQTYGPPIEKKTSKNGT